MEATWETEMPRNLTIAPEDRAWAAAAHLSSLAWVLIPGLGILMPIVLILTQEHRPAVKAIAKQALYLSIAAFIVSVVSTILFVTIILIPISILLWAISAIAQFALPIWGAVRSLDGEYFRYPIIGADPTEERGWVDPM